MNYRMSSAFKCEYEYFTLFCYEIFVEESYFFYYATDLFNRF